MRGFFLHVRKGERGRKIGKMSLLISLSAERVREREREGERERANEPAQNFLPCSDVILLLQEGIQLPRRTDDGGTFVA